ncbi:MAG: type II toxin-antitoxin system prevent-host-death family antitoxin [Pseudomonadota bacterium]
MIIVTSVEAQNRFGQLLDSAQREPITITRHGRTAAYIISPQEMAELEEARRGRSAQQALNHRKWADACSEGWNTVEEQLGSFADEHSTL